ncbi:HdeD family acid-resistance protein [Notoacmeibacter ruber]|uniref:HdeD family acid-resistance protein n=1 Tax=Notoacmeibacter ruber TaxID=2670375 RepID=A0A3L7JKC8_9HYPH|nr:DUF308 domain-containing protein [Notoacmeibacter ruber]RLQ88942.1 HdeD family acid-resistance protein [Notoacmeibacter ruber]
MAYDPTHSETRLATSSGNHWGWQLAFGIILLIGGLIALLNPFAASMAATTIAAIVFLFVGIMQIVMAVRDIHGTASRVATGILGALLILFAILLMFDPIGGIISLTLMIGFFFIAMGAARLWIAMRMRERRGWGWLAAAGVITIVLGIATLFFATAGDLALLGLFLAVDLLFAGGAAIAQAMMGRTQG